MQIRYATDLSAEQYVRTQAWKEAKLDSCPTHLQGGCGFGKNGTYSRKYPRGTKVARWYCEKAHQTFSLLPDCLSSRLSGTLNEVEAVILHVEESVSQEKAVDKIRIDIELAGALRWIRRRLKLVKSSLAILIELMPDLFSQCIPTILSFRSVLCVKPVLAELRSRSDRYLYLLPPPVGLGPHFLPKKFKKNHFQHKTGTDPPV